MCSTEEYANMRLKSVWRTMNTAPTATEKSPSASMERSQNGAAASGIISRKRTIAKKEQLRSAPERSAETGAGASECASGSHVWNGASPVFVPYPARMNAKPAVYQRTLPMDWACSTSIVPKSAKLMPMEQMRRYFHMASRLPASRL